VATATTKGIAQGQKSIVTFVPHSFEGKEGIDTPLWMYCTVPDADFLDTAEARHLDLSVSALTPAYLI
jgi:hypothetical protein